MASPELRIGRRATAEIPQHVVQQIAEARAVQFLRRIVERFELQPMPQIIAIRAGQIIAKLGDAQRRDRLRAAPPACGTGNSESPVWPGRKLPGNRIRCRDGGARSKDRVRRASSASSHANSNRLGISGSPSAERRPAIIFSGRLSAASRLSA